MRQAPYRQVPRLTRKLRTMKTADLFAAKLDRLPRPARAGLLAASIAAAFALAGTSAHASPVKDAPTGPAVILEAQPGPSFAFKSDTALEFECSLDDAAFDGCASPV